MYIETISEFYVKDTCSRHVAISMYFEYNQLHKKLFGWNC